MCVGVTVCVQQTFCQLAYTGQTPQQIFTVDSLKDADLRKCSRWWIITVKGPKSPNFGDLNLHFKPNMRNIQTAIYSDLCIRLTWNLTVTSWVVSYGGNQDGGRPPFWKSIYRHISVKNYQTFMTWSNNEKSWIGQTFSTLPWSNWLRRASIWLAWYRHMPASSSCLINRL